MIRDNSIKHCLAADIGGTNTNLAIMYGRNTLFYQQYSSISTDFYRNLDSFLASAMANGIARPGLACFCAAGRVRDGQITLTNAGIRLETKELEARLGIPCFLLNDFSAVAWGIYGSSRQADEMISLSGHTEPPVSDEGPLVAIGAGTGLGFAWGHSTGGIPQVFPSEGGHISMPVFSRETEALAVWLEKKYAESPGAEAAASGIGLSNLLEWLASKEKEPSPLVKSILALEPKARGKAISAGWESDSLCKKAMELFIAIYARVSANMALVFIPTAGLYLGGGIPSKNLELFKALFMNDFLPSYRDHTRGILKDTAVFILKNYSLSLRGASYAAHIYSGREPDKWK